MKREINLPSKSLIPECWGYKGEVEHSRLIITLPDDIAACDYCQAEVAIKGKRYPTDRLEIADGKVSFELTAAMVKESGAISAQAIGYVVDEDGNIGEIGKTAIYRGTIKPSVSGEISETPEETEFWQRCWAGLQALLEKKHAHKNMKTLERISENGDLLTYDGKKIVDSSVLTVVEEKSQLDELSNNSLLCYVSTDRIGFTPVALESGVQYGGLLENKDRDTLHIDPMLLNLFPCEAFTVTTEAVSINSEGTKLANYEFSTDGSTYFYFKYFLNEESRYIRLYNNTTSELVIDDITYPVGWSEFSFVSGEGNKAIEIPIFTESMYAPYFRIFPVKFSTNDHFTELQNIISGQQTYSGGTRGYYQYYNSSWVSVNFARVTLNTNSAVESSHTHDNKAVLDSITEQYVSVIKTIINNGLIEDVAENTENIDSLKARFDAFESDVNAIEALIDESGVLVE